MSAPAAAPDAIEATRRWIERVVIGLELCPFARAPHAAGRVRYVVTDAATELALVDVLRRELLTLAATDPAQCETTLVIHPQVLGDFLAFNDFLDVADALVRELDLEGVLQIASFHPDYQFAGTRPGDIENATNRSPYPTLHLLREASIARAVEAMEGATHTIYERNVRTLRRLGSSGLARLLK